MIEFSKIHGLGNDFIVVNQLLVQFVQENEKKEFAIKYCNRNFSIGADGVLFLEPSQEADFKMELYNSDGSQAENCVNGLRCVVLEKFLMDGKKQIDYVVETGAGLVRAKVIDYTNKKAMVELIALYDAEINEKNTITLNNKLFEVYPVKVGNPHAVFFIDEPVKNFPIEKIGHEVEHHSMFAPNRANAEFVNVLSSNHAVMRVHERGVCETQACGSGSIAVVLAGIKAGLLEENKWVKVQQPGGVLNILASGKILLRGHAEKVFTGVIK